MSLIPWKSIYSFGIEELDRQHRELLALINKAYQFFISKNPQKKECIDTIAEIVKYLNYHFSYEEDFLRIVGLSMPEEHLDEHRDILTRLQTFFTLLDPHKLDIPLVLFTHLRIWFFDHELTEDQKIVSLYRKALKE